MSSLLVAQQLGLPVATETCGSFCSTLQVCGALKNVVALAGGFCEGMGQGTNTKAAILRLGVEEIKTFIMTFFGDLLAVSNVDRADEHSQ